MYRARHAKASGALAAVSAATVVAVVTGWFTLGPATADSMLDPLQLAQAQKANCQVLQSHAVNNAQRTRATQCITDQNVIISALTPPSTTTVPSTTVPPTTTPPVVTTPAPTTVPPTTTPPATTVPPPSGNWPGPSNTGVPVGVTLTTYTGPCTITTANFVIDSKQVNCSLEIRAQGVVIKNSRVKGIINSDELTTFSYSLIDSEVDASGIGDRAAVGTTGITIRRANIHGGMTLVYCWAHCDVRDSWLHDPYIAPGSTAHLGGVLANDNDGVPHPSNDTGITDLTLIHNTIHCNTPPTGVDGGCSGDVNLFGDFGTVRYVLVDNNLLKASSGISYCTYGGDSKDKPYKFADHIVFTNNVFERGTTNQCGNFGPSAGFNPAAAGNTWTGNVWDSGGTVPSSN